MLVFAACSRVGECLRGALQGLVERVQSDQVVPVAFPR